MRMAMTQAIFMRMCVGMLGNSCKLRHFGLRQRVGTRQPMRMTIPANAGMVMRDRCGAMRCRACMVLVIASYWHVHFQSCMFQVMG